MMSNTNSQRSDFELNHDIYEKVYSQNTEALYEPFLEVIVEIIRKNKFSNILDYACGPAKVGAYLKKALAGYNYTIDGVDISQKALDAAGKYYDSVYLGNGTDIPDRHYDIVLLNSIIEHICPEKLEVLLSKISKATDSIFIVVPNFKSPRRYLLGRSRELAKEREELGHVNILSQGDIRALLKRNGFSKVQFSFYHHFKDLGAVPYKLFGKAKLFYRFYFLLSLFPFYYLRDSFWIYAAKKD